MEIKKLLLVFIYLTLTCSCYASGGNSINNVVEDKFESHYNSWASCRNTTSLKFSSNAKDYLKCDGYKETVQMGDIALPYLISKIIEDKNNGFSKGDFILWHAIYDISGIKLFKDEEIQVSEQEIALRYVDWWQATLKKK